ncbi:OsmC family protein [Amycolatopsis rubida]|uniref:Uncharacterized OsmC-related protein n=1 Tax=Amycolatopsis rubida TaxID=112413 RepID=A0A1I6AH44_9PSEU|nr:OsmC family protein [Amycolatopsis rubida]SFQ68038.1 Uncharacterized OsmC-related protein [Amycolatopsis rubida]
MNEAGINDVNMQSLATLVESVRQDPANARTTWSSRVRWLGGFRSEARTRGLAPTEADEPMELAGGNSAPSPVEHLLGALGNCLAVGYAANAALTGITIEQLSVEIRGSLDLQVFLGLKEGHAGFDSITASVRIVAEASRTDLEALHARVIASSPVGHTLSNVVPVSVELAPSHPMST